MIRLAIDPGDIHVGWCLGRRLDGVGPPGLQWDVVCEEMTPDECVQRLKVFLGTREEMYPGFPIEIVVEEFVLYAGQDRRNVGNTMATSELIGKIEYVCAGYGVQIIRQPASVKKPTRAQLRGRGIRQVGVGTHQRDAELHLWYRTLREEERAE